MDKEDAPTEPAAPEPGTAEPPAPLPLAGAGVGALRPVRINIRFPTLRTVSAMVIRDMSTSSGRAPGGFLWTVIEPVLGIILLSVLVRGAFREPPIGTVFAIFYASGILPFYLYTNVQTKVAGAIMSGRQLLTYPRVTMFDAIAARAIVAATTQILVGIMVLAAIQLIYDDTRTTFEIPKVLLSCAMAISVALGFGLLNAYLWAVHPLWRSFWGLISRPLILISGVIILPETIPQPYRDWLWWNPVLHVVGEMHDAFFFEYEAAYVSPVYVFGLSLVAGTLGLLMLRRYYRDLLEF